MEPNINNKQILQLGDTVWWSGNWGTGIEKKAKVTKIDLMLEPGNTEECFSVDAIRWDNLEDVVVSLDNNHWAYGYQLKPI